MLKKTGIFVLALAIAIALSFSAVQAKGFKDLSFNGSYLPKHPTVTGVFLPFFKAAEEKFPGKDGLSFHYFSTNELYPEAEGIRALGDGRVDFGNVRPAVYPGNMNLLGVVAIPGMAPNATVGSLIAQDLIDEFPEVRAQLPPNSTPFVTWASAPYQFHTIDPVKSVDELKGKKIIVWDADTLEIAKALGANPIRMSSPDTYLALSKGMADGVLCPLAPVRSYKVNEAAKHHLILNLGVNSFVENVHTPLWNEMPKDMQDWLKEQGGKKMALAIGQSLDDGAARDTKWMEDQGNTFYYLTDEERVKALEPLKIFIDKWKTETCKNEDPAVVEKVLKYAQERSKYHTEQQKAGAYDKRVTY